MPAAPTLMVGPPREAKNCSNAWTKLRGPWNVTPAMSGLIWVLAPVAKLNESPLKWISMSREALPNRTRSKPLRLPLME